MMPGRTTRRLTWVAVGLTVLAAGLVTGLLSTRLQAPASPRAAPVQLSSAQGATAPPAASPASGSGWWKPLPKSAAAFVPAQLVIERLRVQASIEIKGIDSHNVMEAPDKGTEAAWYRFSSRPGSGSNAVFAGHRDFGQVGNPAIFWHLDQLVSGDLVDVVSPQQTEFRYRVTQTWDYGLSDIPMQKVLATDPVDEVTLITCSGTYSRGLGYDHRLVVRAVRVA
jgi:sortase A